MATAMAPRKIKLSVAAQHYMKDVFHVSAVEKITPASMRDIIENGETIGLSDDADLDQELKNAYFAHFGLQPMTAHQFAARRC